MMQRFWKLQDLLNALKERKLIKELSRLLALRLGVEPADVQKALEEFAQQNDFKLLHKIYPPNDDEPTKHDRNNL